MLVNLLFHTALYDVHVLKISGKKKGLGNLGNVIFGTVCAICMYVKLVTYQGICRAEEKAFRLSGN